MNLVIHEKRCLKGELESFQQMLLNVEHNLVQVEVKKKREESIESY